MSSYELNVDEGLRIREVELESIGRGEIRRGDV